jgi:hypothetical protein
MSTLFTHDYSVPVYLKNKLTISHDVSIERRCRHLYARRVGRHLGNVSSRQKSSCEKEQVKVRIHSKAEGTIFRLLAHR